MKMKRDNRLVILVICIILICIVTFLGFKTHGEVEELVQQQFNEQQLLLARQAALGIGEFADERVTIIEILARDRSEDSIDNITGCFKPIYEETSGFYSIEFIDTNGVVVYGYPEYRAPIGYNVYAENRSSVFGSVRDLRETEISSSTALFEGGLGSFIWVPVYEGEEFRGVILGIIRMSTITDRFLTPIMQNRTGYVYLIDRNGKSLYDGTRREAIGKNYIKMLKEVNTNASWLEILNEQINGSEGTAVYLKEGDESNSEQIVAYAPVRWRDKIWSVGISVPASEVDHLIRSVYAKQMIFLSTVIAIILGGSFGLILMFSRWNKTLEAEVESKTCDLTRTNEELAQANERLKELDKLKSEFVSMVSHELKTPLAAMKTSAQVLELAEADIKILTGDITLHYYAGFGGGRKSILPGISSREAIQRNHALLVDDQARTANIDNNPVHLDMLEAASFAPPDIVLNAVTDATGTLVDAYAGEMNAVFLKGAEVAREIFRIETNYLFDVLLVSAGGFPKDRNLYQASKAVENCYRALVPAGKFILVAECRDGIGDAYFEEWMNKYTSYKAAEEAIKTNFVLGGHKAYYMRKTLERVRLSIVSELDSNTLTSWGLNAYKSVPEALNAEIGFNVINNTNTDIADTKAKIKIGILRNGLDTLLVQS